MINLSMFLPDGAEVQMTFPALPRVGDQVLYQESRHRVSRVTFITDMYEQKVVQTIVQLETP